MKFSNGYLVILIIIYGNSVLASPSGLNYFLTRNISKLRIINYSKYQCVTGLIKQEVPCGSFFTLVHGINQGDRLIQQLSANDCYNFIVRSPQTQKWLLRSKAYIFLLKKFTEFTEVFEKLSNDFAWTPTAKFFIIIQHLKNEEYLEVFTILSKLNIFHVHLIPTVETDEIYVYTYNPFLNNSCGHVKKENVKINVCRENKKVEINRNEKENQLRNCSFTILALENPPNVIFKTNKKLHNHGISSGIEQYMIKNIAKSENYKLQFIVVNRQKRYSFVVDNCSSTSTLRYLTEHPLGVSIGGYVLLKRGSVCYDFIWGYCYANFNVYTSLRGVENWRIVYQAFGMTTWALTVVSYCAVAFATIIIYKIFVGKINQKFLALKIWGYLNSHSDERLIKIRELKIIMITWIWFTFFIINFYNTGFYRLLTAPDKKGMIVKPDKLYSSSLKPCISLKIRSWFKFTYNLTLPSQNQDECQYDDTALEAVAENDELFTLVSEPSSYKREYKYLDKLGHPKLDRWRYGTGDYVFSIFTNRGFPLRDKFQRYAFYHFESGLLLKHTEDIFHQFVVVSEFRASNLQDFKIHFTVLFLGCIISLIIFIVEINQEQK